MSGSPLTLRDVLAGSGGELRGSAAPDLPLSSVRHDSRLVEPGALFVALRGPKHDGHAFVVEALARRAAAALVERVPSGDVRAEGGEGPPLIVVPDTLAALRRLAGYRLSRYPAEIVAVDGSIGKRTTAELIVAVLGQRCSVVQAAAVRRPEVAIPLAILNAGKQVSRVVLELGLSGPDELGALLDLAGPGCVVITNLEAGTGSPGEQPSADERAEALRGLVRAVAADGSVVLNADDEPVRAMATAGRAVPILFGLDEGAGVRAEAVVGRGLLGTEFDLVIARRRVHVRLPLLGSNALHAGLAAAAVGLAEGLELGEIGAGLQTASATARIIVATGVNGSRIIDDSYNATPESNLEALNLLAELDGRKIAVLGDMLNLGSLETSGHYKVGNRAARVADQLVTVGKRAALMADEARRMGLAAADVFAAQTTDEAIEHLRRRLQPGDNVLVKGSREMQLETIVRALRREG